MVTPLGNDVTMRSADSDQGRGFRLAANRVELGNGVAVTVVPTRHWSARGLFRQQQGAVGEFVPETPVGKLYIVCDSATATASIRRVAEAHGPLRLAILPIGAYEPRWFMEGPAYEPSDAV